MRTRRRNVTEDGLTIGTRRSTRLKTSLNEVENSVEIPVDLIVEILLRLPAKSRCVSKLWGSLICRQYFTELFLTRSLHRPQLLFACKKDGKLFFFSSPQLQNPVENSSATSLMSFSCSFEFSRPVHGLICLTHRRLVEETKEQVIVICNPSTGQTLNLPKPMTRIELKSYLLYEPIKKQFKVLLSRMYEHQVLTLGTGKPSWRMIECSMFHSNGMSEICINGVLYYPAFSLSLGYDMIVCFDGISEKFKFITGMEDFTKAARDGTLINYHGKLASLVCEKDDRFMYGSSSRNIELWILQDAEKQVWSKHTYVLPAWLQNIVGTDYILHFFGITLTNEIILAQCNETVPFYVFYFSIEKKTMIRVAIHGMEAFQDHLVFTYLDHVENVKLMHMF